MSHFFSTNIYSTKKGVLLISLISSVFLMWCGSSSTNKITVENISLSIPKEYQTISPSSLDNAQITHNIIAARRSSGGNIILASSTLPAQVSLKEFAEKTKTRISQEMIGYTNSSISTEKFTCNEEKKTWYLHSFDKVEIKDKTKILASYDQFYFIESNSLYILSVAQTTKKSIINDLIWSLACWKATTTK